MQQPFSPVHEPNDVWSADFKGQFRTTDGCWCYPLTIMDHQSRFLLGCRNLVGTRFEQTKAEFEKLFREYGLPWRIRTDNGVPFASVAPGGISQLSKWWIRLGIMPERIEPGKPQQNGCHERMHRTLKQDTARPPAETVDLQQGRFDVFCRDYNHERPHESLGQQTPASCYESSRRPMPERLPELEYPGPGRSRRRSLGRVLRTCSLGLFRQKRIEKWPQHLLHPQVSPMSLNFFVTYVLDSYTFSCGGHDSGGGFRCWRAAVPRRGRCFVAGKRLVLFCVGACLGGAGKA
jgi:hypothetical protein